MAVTPSLAATVGGKAMGRRKYQDQTSPLDVSSFQFVVGLGDVMMRCAVLGVVSPLGVALPQMELIAVSLAWKC